MRQFALFACAVWLCAAGAVMPVAADTRPAIDLQAGDVVLLRHALAPGTGDPANFRLRDCATQRNLSDRGRAQAARIGEMIRQTGMRDVTIHSSQWCRCLETARLLGLGSVQELLVLNSFFQRWENKAAQTQGLSAWLANADRTTLNVLVTHQVNVTALTGVYPASGEMVVVRASPTGEIEVVRRIETE